MAKVVVLTGGGIKGAVAAARSARDHELILLHVEYEQPSARAESRAIEPLSETFPAARVIEVSLPQQPKPARRSSEAAGPRGRGRADSEPGGSPVAAARGLMPVLLSVGVQWALRLGASTVGVGLSRFAEAAHLGLIADQGPTEGRREFVHAFNLMLESLPAQKPKIRVDAPLMDITYSQMIQLARRFGVPLEHTWTCERAGPRPCGRCDACKARAGAFIEAAIPDPLMSAASVSA